jgi:co-chaperonin GroES (HSP10)
LPDKVEEKTKGGIIIPPTERDREQHAATQGTLIAVSPMAFTFSDWPAEAPKPKPGDRVAFPRYVGHVIKGKDNEDYWLLNDKDICATLESKNGR